MSKNLNLKFKNAKTKRLVDFPGTRKLVSSNDAKDVDPTAYTYLQVSEKSLQPHKVWLVARNSKKGLSN